MKRDQFESEVKRMIGRWGDAGKRHFTVEFNRAVWAEVWEMDHRLFASAVTYAVGEFRHPPVLSQLREALSKVRSEYYRQKKEEMSRDAQEFVDEAKIDSTEVQMRMKIIKDRIAGRCPDKDFNEFQQFLQKQNGEVRKDKVD